MMNDNFSVTDELLTAYLDGAVSEQEQADLEAAFEADPELAQRLEALQVPDGIFASAFDMDAMDAPQMPEALRAKIAAAAPAMAPVPPFPPSAATPVVANTNKAPRFAWPMAIAASFALGMVMATALGPKDSTDLASATPGWVETVASYQALYTTETLSGTVQDRTVSSAILARARDELGVDLTGALDIEGLTFKRVQVLAIDGAPLIQMAYLDAEGRPFAFCLTRRDDADQDALSKMSWDLATSSWVEDGVGFVLVGGEDTDRVGEIAQQFRGVI